MGRRRRAAPALVAAAALAAALACATACTAQPPASTPRAETRSPAPASTPSAAPTLDPIVFAPGETVLGRLEAQQGASALGPFARTGDTLAVTFVCSGEGTATVAIEDVGSFPADCAHDPGGVRNEFDVRSVAKLFLTVQPIGDVTWSLGASEP